MAINKDQMKKSVKFIIGNATVWGGGSMEMGSKLPKGKALAVVAIKMVDYNEDTDIDKLADKIIDDEF